MDFVLFVRKGCAHVFVGLVVCDTTQCVWVWLSVTTQCQQPAEHVDTCMFCCYCISQISLFSNKNVHRPMCTPSTVFSAYPSKAFFC